jgi:hypothetical protein
MYLSWQRVELGSTGTYQRGDCPHPTKGLGREAIRPIVRHAHRVDGKPRNVVVARPGPLVRRCCLDAGNPIALGRFWSGVRNRTEEEILRIGLAREVYTSLQLELWRDRVCWLYREMEKTVPEVGGPDRTLYDLFERPERRGAPGARGFEAQLEEARARVEAYQRTKRRSETPRDWWLRTEPPPDYDRKRAERERDAAQALWAEAYGRMHDGSGWRERVSDFRAGFAQARGLDGAPAAAKALGLAWPCSVAEFKAAWRRLVKTAHPDQGGTAEAFRAAKAAHDSLTVALGL